jgi:hypothetical protein
MFANPTWRSTSKDTLRSSFSAKSPHPASIHTWPTETAIAIAGGFTPRAFRDNVIVNRNYYGRPLRISVPMSFPLRPGDTVNVQERWF